MAYRAVVFLVTVIVAVAAGLFVRQGEQDALRAGRKWPGPAELRSQDALLAAQPGSAPHNDVVIVAADDRSAKRYGALPWRRDVWARGVRRVQEGGAKAVVFDLALDERTSPAADAALWRTMANGRRTVLGLGYDARKAKWTADDVRSLRFLEKSALAEKVTLRGAAATQLFPWPQFEAPVSDFMGSARNAGVFVREEDPDGVVRHARMLYLSRVETPPTSARLPATLPQSRLNGATVAFPSLALAGAMQTFDVDKGRVRAEQDLVKFDGDLDPPVRIPIDGFGRMAIRYAGPVNTYERVSFEDVAEGKVAAASFRNKVVLFGATTTGSEATDIRRTPRGEMPRVEITANALGSILGRTYLKRSRGGDVLATLVLVGIPAGLLLARRRPGAVVATGVVLALLYLAVAWAVVAFVDLLLPVTPVLVVIGVVTLLALAAERVFAAREAALPGGGGAL